MNKTEKKDIKYDDLYCKQLSGIQFILRIVCGAFSNLKE